MHDPAGEEIGHRRQADMRVRAHIGAARHVRGKADRPDMVEEDERPDHPPLGKGRTRPTSKSPSDRRRASITISSMSSGPPSCVSQSDGVRESRQARGGVAGALLLPAPRELQTIYPRRSSMMHCSPNQLASRIEPRLLAVPWESRPSALDGEAQLGGEILEIQDRAEMDVRGGVPVVGRGRSGSARHGRGASEHANGRNWGRRRWPAGRSAPAPPAPCAARAACSVWLSTATSKASLG